MRRISQENTLVETPDDIRAIQALSLYARRLPVPLIGQQLGVSRATAYRLIDHGKQLVGPVLTETVLKTLLLSDDLIRQSFLQLQEIDNMIDDEGKPVSQIAKQVAKQAITNQINQFLQTQLKAVQVSQPKSESVTVESVQTEQGTGTRITLKRESKTVTELMEELRKEGKFENTS